MRTKLAAAVPLLLLLLSPAWAQHTGSFHRSYHLNGPVRLTVETGSGSIHVTGAPGSAVTVDATISQGWSLFGGSNPADIAQIEAHPPIDQAGNTVVIHRVNPGWINNVSISYVITTPPDTSLQAHTGSGSIQVEGLKDPAELGAGSGRIAIADLAASVHAQTGSGTIEFGRVGGELRLGTGSGSIRGQEAGGRLSATTGSGDIQVGTLDAGGEVHAASGEISVDQVRGDFTAHTASGSIHVGGQLAGDSQWNLSTASGSIRIALPASAVANVRLQTASGGIRVDHPTEHQESFGRHSWQGVIGTGGARPTATLIAHTASGSITVN